MELNEASITPTTIPAEATSGQNPVDDRARLQRLEGVVGDDGGLIGRVAVIEAQDIPGMERRLTLMASATDNARRAAMNADSRAIAAAGAAERCLAETKADVADLRRQVEALQRTSVPAAIKVEVDQAMLALKKARSDLDQLKGERAGHRQSYLEARLNRLEEGVDALEERVDALEEAEDDEEDAEDAEDDEEDAYRCEKCTLVIHVDDDGVVVRGERAWCDAECLADWAAER